MKNTKRVRLLLNEDRDHGDVLGRLLKSAERLECLVAFAKMSALNELLQPLRKALARGLHARFAVGLDFHLTEPAVLHRLLTLTRDHSIKLYLSDSSDTFHPKVYAFQNRKGYAVIVGSANFTHGGLYGNHEASALMEDESGALMASITRYFDALIADEVLVPATKGRIDEYEREYAIHDIYRKLARKKAQNEILSPGVSFKTLADILEVMKSDDTELGFSRQKIVRRENQRRAARMLERWATKSGDASRGFLGRFESLIDLFHSGGLQRGKSRIADYPSQFVAAIAEIVGKPGLPPGEAFAVLKSHFKGIPQAGINLLTEILHALDSRQYAVMNQNAVSGLALAGFRVYPQRPSKQNVSADDYARYCQHAQIVREELGLEDFTDLDSLFNYAYWSENAGERLEH